MGGRNWVNMGLGDNNVLPLYFDICKRSEFPVLLKKGNMNILWWSLMTFVLNIKDILFKNTV